MLLECKSKTMVIRLYLHGSLYIPATKEDENLLFSVLNTLVIPSYAIIRYAKIAKNQGYILKFIVGD